MTRLHSMATIIWAEGPDAASFLHGLLSNDIEHLDVGGTTPALLLDATGHVQVTLRVHRTADDEFTLVTDIAQGGRLAELLDEYHFSEDVEILGPEPVELTVVDDPDRVSGADLVIAGSVPGTFDAVGGTVTVRADEATVAVEPDAFEARRIAAGVPLFGVDIGPRTLVHEAGLERTAVSFTKGCYLGQETVARVEHRGGVRRRLAGLRLSGSVERGAEVTHEGRLVGTVTSVAEHPTLGPIALGTLRTEAGAGDHVRVAGQTGDATIVDLPFPASWDET